MTAVAWAGFLAFVAYFIGMITLHFLPTGRKPLYNTVSDYSVGRYGALARALTALNVLGAACLLAALAGSVGSPPIPVAGLDELAVLAASRLGLVVFVTDESGTEPTRRGMLHAVLALVSFAAAISAATTITPALAAIPAWQGVYPALRATASLATPLVIVMVLSLLPRTRRIFGLSERLFLADVNLWLLLAAAGLALHG